MDLERVFLGEESWAFLAEVVFRTTVLYAFTFALLRLLSRRTVANLSAFEVLLIIALGSAVGDPMFYADVPLLHGMAVIATIVVINRGAIYVMNRSKRVERLMEGSPQRLLIEGRLDLEGMQRTDLAREELFEQLRIDGVEHLGQVRVAYIEQNGELSIFRYPPGAERSGLPIEPLVEVEPRQQFEADHPAPVAGHYACYECGETVAHEREAPLQVCVCEHTSRVLARAGAGTRRDG